MVILETQELLKTFGGLTAVNHVSLHVDEGEIFGLIGPNGAGKTTFINCITGTYAPSGGRVHFLGADTTGQRADVMCHKGMARTFQICQPFPQLTALENVLAASSLARRTSIPGNRKRSRRGCWTLSNSPCPKTSGPSN
jgi:branched-chain amino acid transport system ATP-binding protein